MKKKQEKVPLRIETEDENNHFNLGTLPNSSVFSDLMTKTLGSLMSSSSSLKLKSSRSGATVVGVPIYTLGGDKLINTW